MVYNNYICNNGEKYKEKKSFSVLKVEYGAELMQNNRFDKRVYKKRYK